MNAVETGIQSQLVAIDVLRQDQLMQSVLSYTSAVVHEAMQGNWNKVLDTVDQRRQVMDRLVAINCSHYAECINALRSAVEESERAVARVVAHAIASSRRPGAMFALRH